MNQASLALRDFLLDDTGATLIEYGLLAGLISIVAIAMLTDIGANVNVLYTAICTAIAPVGGIACA